MKTSIHFDRLSCMEYASNKVRLVLYCLAYVLFQRLRRVARAPGCAAPEVGKRLRLSLIEDRRKGEGKPARVQVESCSHCPTQQAPFRVLAGRLGARPGSKRLGRASGSETVGDRRPRATGKVRGTRLPREGADDLPGCGSAWICRKIPSLCGSHTAGRDGMGIMPLLAAAALARSLALVNSPG